MRPAPGLASEIGTTPAVLPPAIRARLIQQLAELLVDDLDEDLQVSASLVPVPDIHLPVDDLDVPQRPTAALASSITS